MSSENAGQVLLQVQSPLRPSALRSHEAALLALQLLAWAHLTRQGKLQGRDALDSALQGGDSGIADALGRLALQEDVLGIAFSDAQRLAQYAEHNTALAAAVTAKRLVEGGIFERFSAVDIAADLLQTIPDGYAIPAELATLMAHLAVGSEQKAVYCPWDSGVHFLAALMHEDVALYLESPHQPSLPALLSLFRKAPTTLVASNPLRTPTAIKGGHLEKFDAALSLPPMGWSQPTDEIVGQDIYGRFPVQKATSTGLLVQHILAQTKGPVALTVPNSFLFGPGKDRYVREFLLGKGWVEAVIALPPSIHQTVNIATSLILLDTCATRRQVGFIDATQPFFQKSLGKGRITLGNLDAIIGFCNALMDDDELRASRILDNTRAVVASIEEIEANESSLQVDRYVMADEQRALRARLETMPTVALEEVAHFINPIPHKDRGVESDYAIEVMEVGAADLPAAGYIGQPTKTLYVQASGRKSGSSGDVFLRPGDVLIITKGSVGKVGIVPAHVPSAGSGGWVAGQSAVVLRGKENYTDLRGIGLWLRSPMGQTLLAGVVSGATIPMISIQTLRRMKVPLLALEATHDAVGVLKREADLQRQIETLRVEQSTLSEQFWKERFH